MPDYGGGDTSCGDLCREPGGIPTDVCPPGYHREGNSILCVPDKPENGNGDNGNGGEPEDPWARLGDLLGSLGGGGILPMPQEAITYSPVETQERSPLAILLIVGALAAGGYYFYQRQKKTSAGAQAI